MVRVFIKIRKVESYNLLQVRQGSGILLSVGIKGSKLWLSEGSKIWLGADTAEKLGLLPKGYTKMDENQLNTYFNLLIGKVFKMHSEIEEEVGEEIKGIKERSEADKAKSEAQAKENAQKVVKMPKKQKPQGTEEQALDEAA